VVVASLAFPIRIRDGQKVAGWRHGVGPWRRASARPHPTGAGWRIVDRGRGAHLSYGSTGGHIGRLGVLHGLGFTPGAGALLRFQK
jgi:hypothetical protein